MAARITLVASRGWRLAVADGAVRLAREGPDDGPPVHIIIDAKSGGRPGSPVPEVMGTVVRGGPRHIHLELVDQAEPFADLSAAVRAARARPPGGPPTVARIIVAGHVDLDDLNEAFVQLPKDAELVLGLEGDRMG